MVRYTKTRNFMNTNSFKDFIKGNDSMLFEMSNLWPKETGLNEIIWVSVKNANHEPRIKIYKNKQPKGENFSVTIEDEPKVIGKVFVNSKELENIKSFVRLNRDNLIKYWEFQISTNDMTSNIQKV